MSLQDKRPLVSVLAQLPMPIVSSFLCRFGLNSMSVRSLPVPRLKEQFISLQKNQSESLPSLLLHRYLMFTC
jgi:hypothetical protein